MYGETDRRRTITDASRFDISNYLQTFLQKLSADEKRLVKINSQGEAERIKLLLNMPQNNQFISSMYMDGHAYCSEQEVDYVQSNLGSKNGYIFYFVCGNCERRVKYLYSIYNEEEPYCRTCLRLHYKQPGRKQRALSGMFNKNYLSTEYKYMAMKKLGITKNDIANYLSDYSES